MRREENLEPFIRETLNYIVFESLHKITGHPGEPTNYYMEYSYLGKINKTLFKSLRRSVRWKLTRSGYPKISEEKIKEILKKEANIIVEV